MQSFSVFETILAARFGGHLQSGSHAADGAACLLEAAHYCVGDAWSDAPDRWPDLRPLNDAPWSSDAARTAALVPVLRAYWDWGNWPVERQRATVERLVLLTVQRLISALPGLPEAIRVQCRKGHTLAAAVWAAEAAWAEAEAVWAVAAAAAAEAAAWAARAAEAAAWAARAAADSILQGACQLWIEAAQAATEPEESP